MIATRVKSQLRPEAKCCLSVLFLLVFFAGAAWGQVTASIIGSVKDSTGAVVPDATVTVKHVDTGTMRTVQTDANGDYNVPSLQIGQYEVTVEKSGFKQEVRRGITLAVGQQAVVNITLEIGNVQQQVTVTAEAPLINTTLASTAGLVNDKEIKDLPLNGRSFDQLLTLNMGTANYSSMRSATQPGDVFSVSGRRPEENRFLMDGVDYVGASGGSNTTTPNGSDGQVLGVDAIREFNVVQNTYGAEYGKRAGGQVSIVTTSGTNQLHGDLLEFVRNSIFDARNFFDHPQGERIPPFKRNQFGGSLGGPIKKDKMFLFGNYEGLRQRLGVSDVSVVPDADARIGMLPIGPGGAEELVPGLKTGMLPFVQNFWPAPNGPELGNGAATNYSNPLQKVREDYGLARFDHTLSSKDSYFVNYMIQDGENDLPTADPVFISLLPLRSQLLSIQETHVFSPSVVNVATLGFGRAHLVNDTPPVTPFPASLDFITNTEPGTISLGGSSTGASGGSFTTAGGHAGPITYARTFYMGSDDVHVIKGKHSLSAGVWVERIESNRNGGGAAYASVSYSTIQNLLIDDPSTFTAVPVRAMLGFRSTEAAWYVQDEIKLKPNFTFRIGLRDEMTTGYNESQGRCANYVAGQNNVLLTNPIIGNSCLLQNNAIALWQPRAGFAWDPTGTGKWSIRGGAGIYNDLQDNLDQAFGNNPPFNPQVAYTVGPTAGLLSFIPIIGGTPPPPSCSPTQGQPCSIFSPGQLDPNLHTPTVQEWSLTVERELTTNLALRVGYVGSQSYHLEVGLDPNSIEPIICTSSAGCTAGGVGTARSQVTQGTLYVPVGTRPNPYISSVFGRDFPGTSNYNALNVSLIERFNHGLTFRANYTYSKVMDMNSALDTASGGNQPVNILDPYDLKLTKGPAAFSLKHQFDANFSYLLPFGNGQRFGNSASGKVNQIIGGWQWNGIIEAQTGFPFTAEAGSNRSGSGDTLNPDVPSVNPAFSGPVIEGNPNQWFNPAAFLLPAAGTLGNAGRDQYVGPGLAEFDTSLFKNFQINERYRLQFRAEGFNAVNHTNFSFPTLIVFSGTSVSPSAGKITATATSSRQLQFALKLFF